jgi:hypothetical protein
VTVAKSPTYIRHFPAPFGSWLQIKFVFHCRRLCGLQFPYSYCGGFPLQADAAGGPCGQATSHFQ